MDRTNIQYTTNREKLEQPDQIRERILSLCLLLLLWLLQRRRRLLMLWWKWLLTELRQLGLWLSLLLLSRTNGTTELRRRLSLKLLRRGGLTRGRFLSIRSLEQRRLELRLLRLLRLARWSLQLGLTACNGTVLEEVRLRDACPSNLRLVLVLGRCVW